MLDFVVFFIEVIFRVGVLGEAGFVFRLCIFWGEVGVDVVLFRRSFVGVLCYFRIY